MAYIELTHGTIIETDAPEIYDGPFLTGKRLSQKDGKIGLKIQALSSLLALGLVPGDTVYCVLRSVSASGMSRKIDFYIIKENRPFWITGLVANLLGIKRSNSGEGVTIKGAGMDMGFATVYDLGMALWPNGTPEPHGIRNGEEDSSGGYALKSAWI